ncbi:MAG: hypothetical protein IV090_24885 [Candidatus Sericytochromatia bacterium]|nr:hypothetical protein [Candidatus Sericytochromatia bacterium]
MATIIQNSEHLTAEIKVEKNILQLSKQNDPEALRKLFKQFLPENETIYSTEYLGIQGIWGFGAHSFACLTECRVADIKIDSFGEIVYQDGYLEEINSAIVVQPSKLKLYVVLIIACVLAIPSFGITLLLLPLIVRYYYRIVQCGLVFWIREGVPVYIFSNRSLLNRANNFCRNVALARENRIKSIKKMHA